MIKYRLLMIKYRLFLTLLMFSCMGVFLLGSVPAFMFAEDFTGRVISISDGDTISVKHNGKAEQIGLNGIDAPEKGQAFGHKAKQLVSDLAFGKMVKVESKGQDRYGRTIADVFLSDGRRTRKAGIGCQGIEEGPVDRPFRHCPMGMEKATRRYAPSIKRFFAFLWGGRDIKIQIGFVEIVTSIHLTIGRETTARVIKGQLS